MFISVQSLNSKQTRNETMFCIPSLSKHSFQQLKSTAIKLLAPLNNNAALLNKLSGRSLLVHKMLKLVIIQVYFPLVVIFPGERGGGGGVTPREIGWGCAACLLKPSTPFQTKMAEKNHTQIGYLKENYMHPLSINS